MKIPQYHQCNERNVIAAAVVAAAAAAVVAILNETTALGKRQQRPDEPLRDREKVVPRQLYYWKRIPDRNGLHMGRGGWGEDSNTRRWMEKNLMHNIYIIYIHFRSVRVRL